MEKHYIVMTKEWDFHAEGTGAWVWRLFTDSVVHESSLHVILDGLEASGKAYAYGEVQNCTCSACLREILEVVE